MEGYRYYTGSWNTWTNKNPDVVPPDVTNAASGGFKNYLDVVGSSTTTGMQSCTKSPATL